MSETYLIGDVHGCFFTLKKLLKKIPKTSKLIFLGDLGDKGNFSFEVYDFVIKNNHTLILGNHDYMILKYLEKALEGKLKNLWTTNNSFGGYNTIKSYRKIPNKQIKEHLDFIKKSPTFLKINNLFLTHGYGLPYYKRRNQLKNKKLKYFKSFLSNRHNNSSYIQDWEDLSSNNSIINIYGHCNVKEIEIRDNSIGIDTGCVYGGKLTALKLSSIFLNNENKVDISKLDYIQESVSNEDIFKETLS